MNWNERFIREAGVVNPSLLAPCSGNADCGTCAHFDELMAVAEKGTKGKPGKPLSPQEKKHNEKMLSMKTRHQEARI